MVERLKAEHNVDVEWRPFYLYFDTPPEGRELPEHVKRARASGQKNDCAKWRSPMGWNSFPHSGSTTHASPTKRPNMPREHGKGNEFHKVVFRKVYAEGQDPSQWDVLRSAAEEVGLDADEMQREVENEKYMAEVVDKVRWAYQIGVTGVPTYVINDRYAIVGAQPYEVFKDALEQIMKSKA